MAMRRSVWVAAALAGLLAVSAAGSAHAQSPAGGTAPAGSGSTAGTPGEAPGSVPLAGTDRSGAPESPAEQRSMAFTASSGGECRETVPGGPMLALAYAIVLVVLGVYVAMLARKNAKLATSLEELEAEIARRRGGGAGGDGEGAG